MNNEPVAVGAAVNTALLALVALLPLFGVTAAATALIGAAVVAVANAVVAIVVRSRVSPVEQQ